MHGLMNIKKTKVKYYTNAYTCYHQNGNASAEDSRNNLLTCKCLESNGYKHWYTTYKVIYCFRKFD